MCSFTPFIHVCYYVLNYLGWLLVIGSNSIHSSIRNPTFLVKYLSASKFVISHIFLTRCLIKFSSLKPLCRCHFFITNSITNKREIAGNAGFFYFLFPHFGLFVEYLVTTIFCLFSNERQGGVPLRTQILTVSTYIGREEF